MNNLLRLKLELNNKSYFTDEEYTVFLQENTLSPTVEYDKATMQVSLLYTVLDVIEALLNDVDLYRRVETEFATTGEATQYFNNRIKDIKIRIQNKEDELNDIDNSNPFTLLFTRK